MGSGLIMGYRFYFTKVDVQGFFQQKFAVPGDTRFGDEGTFRQEPVDFGNDFLGCFQRAAFIVLIMGIENFVVFTQEDGLDRRAACIEAEITWAAVR